MTRSLFLEQDTYEKTSLVAQRIKIDFYFVGGAKHTDYSNV